MARGSYRRRAPSAGSSSCAAGAGLRVGLSCIGGQQSTDKGQDLDILKLEPDGMAMSMTGLLSSDHPLRCSKHLHREGALPLPG